jgi:glycogen debranching enzyme
MWDDTRHFYFDLALDGRRSPIKTVAAFWALLAGVASREQAAILAAELGNPKTFARAHRVPTLAADEAAYNPAGGYWCGAVWAPTTTMVVRGLTQYGFGALSREIALNDLDMMDRVFQQTGTIWENYAPDAARPGQPAKADFVGWSGLGPILYLLEFGIGLRPDAPKNQLLWEPVFAGRQGCERYRFNGHVVSLLAQPAAPEIGKLTLTVKSDGEFTLLLKRQDDLRRFPIRAGEQTFEY